MKNKLDITLWSGKKIKLTKSIAKEVERLNEINELPFILVMTSKQYEYIMKTPQFVGEARQWKYREPEQRIYVTDFNAMEVQIK